MLNIGDVAPGFSVQDHTGKAVSLADYQGKTVVMWFYPRASTGG
jgi:peroxiredoxin Q/BCP